MEEILSTPSTSSSASKKVAVTFIEGLRKRLFDSEATPRKVPFKALFTAVLFYLGRVLFQIVVTISGFFPTLVIVSHIGGFILERWLEILSTENGLLRLKKTTLTILQISILDMVCFLEDNLALCVIQDGNNSGSVKAKLLLPAFKTVADLYNEVGKIIKCHEDSFKLILQSNQNEYVSLEYFRTETIEMAGFKVGPDTKNTLFVLPSPDFELPKPHDLRVDSSLSPTESREYETSDAPPPPPPPPPASTSSTSADFDCTNTIIRPQIGYVGLVNQAMTCYLNSLLQALFMTPEFRNAIYNWEFDGSPNEESKSIPYQLQKLFLNLQTSRRSAVETTELTRSFGWDSWEAWQQHDIQELCRVMFDTLEQNFKNTKQADLINRLYEGKMIDYVKCLECSTEKSREDTFLDIPLSVRSFGSNVAYGSVEEALRAFVQPETLEGNNQYHCDTCNKKCDAHKGLKFSKFPYLLTLHLKRFDFDFNTLHRIKLNDKVSFPEKLNLNSFIAHAKGSESNSEASPEETAVKCDDSCTTDSGSALDDEGCQGIDPVNVPNSYENHNSDYQEDDEGIDVEQQQENEKNRQNACESGPYVYELFAIMIHSGSAAGGHYYVYIKDFKDGEWYCFNDQNVARITYDDIRKTYGGGPIRGYYSGAYSSSTNAYMLMYRQIDKEVNAAAITVDEFPEHIKVLHRKMERQKEIDEQKELEEQKELDEERELEDQKELDDHKDTGSVIWNRFLSLFKIKIYCHYPHPNAVTDAKIYMKKEFTIRETLELVYRRLKLDKLVPIERCRLVSYDEVKEAIEYSFEGREDDTIGDTCIYLEHQNFLIDVREENEKFVVYKPGNISTLVILVNVETEEVIGPIVVKANLFQTVKEYKEIFAHQFKLPKGALHIVLEKFSHEPRLLRNDESTLKREGFYDGNKVYVATSLNDEDLEVQKSLILIKLQKIIDRFEHVITLHVALPDVDNEILARLNIPPLENSFPVNNCKPNEGLLNRGTSPGRRDPSPQLVQDAEDESMGPAGPHSDQSASEDSSLTDSERTIVGDTPGDCLAQISPNSSPVGSDQNVSSSENEGNDFSLLKRNSYTGRLITDVHSNSEIENWDAEEEISNKPCNYFFQAVPYTENVSNQKILKVLVDERMSQGTFKQCLEPFVGVSVEHFKICRSYEKHLDLKCSRLSESYFKDEKLTVKLSRALKKGEYAGHVFLLVPNNEEFMKYLFEWVISNGTPVSQVKKEILEELKNKYAIEIPYNRCRLRRKNWKIPMRPYLDGTTFDDLVSDWEMFVQELPGEEPVTSPDKKLLIVRQLCPSTKKLKPFEEIVVDTNSVLECKEKISEISGIPVEFIDTAKAPVCFPSRSFSKFRISNLEVSVLAPYLDVDWNSTTTDNFTLNDYEEGNVILYRDNTKFFQPRDRKMSSKDRRIRLYSRTKERDLKIYLDSTPSRKDESDVD